jgi:hypothetical protein
LLRAPIDRLATHPLGELAVQLDWAWKDDILLTGPNVPFAPACGGALVSTAITP